MAKRNQQRQDWGLPKPEWTRRRRVLYVGLIFCASWLSWVLYKGTDSVLYQNALYVLGGGAVALIGQYVFGAAFDDKHYMDAIAQMRSNGVLPRDEEVTTTTVKDSDADRPLSGGQ
jgi:hypothetical protein